MSSIRGFVIILIAIISLDTSIAESRVLSMPIQDFSNIDLSDAEQLRLDSGWLFFWNELKDPEKIVDISQGIQLGQNIGDWTQIKVNDQMLPSFGYGTYHTRLILPKHRGSLALKLPKFNSSTKLWINQDLVFQAGIVGTSKSNTRHRKQESIIPIDYYGDTITLTVQIANFYSKTGGMPQPIILAHTYSLWQEEKLELISDMILIGSLMFIGISFLILFTVYWSVDKAILYFSIFCICWAYRVLSDDYAPLPYLFESIPWALHVRIEYFSLFIAALTGSLFLNIIFKKDFNQFYPKLNNWFIWIISLLLFIVPSIYLSYLLIAFFIGCSINISYLIWKLTLMIHGENQSKLALGGILSGLIVMSYHIYSYFFLTSVNIILINIGYMIVFMINSLLLGKRFSYFFSDLKMLQKQTHEQNKKIAQQSILLNKTNDDLEAKIAIRTQEIQQVVNDLKERNIHLEQYNYIVSHNLRAPLANISGLLGLYNHESPNDPFNEIVLEKLKSSYTQVDQVLIDLTTILEVKQVLSKTKGVVDFEELVMKIRLVLKKVIENSKANIALDFQVSQIHSFHTFWFSIFLNLISNSIAYRKTDTPCEINIASYQDGNKTILTFEDNGMGIDLIKNKNEIFGLYKRFHTHIYGKGMGLLMVKTKLEAMGGTIDVQSKPNQGCKFTIEIEKE